MERSNEWLNNLKIAVINEDLDSLEKHCFSKLPNFTSLQEANEALSFISQANTIIKKQKDALLNEMNQLKQQKNFMQSQKNSSFEFQA